MTGSMESRKSKLPEANKMARMIRTGRSTGDLAVRYGINSHVIVQQLIANGWDPVSGAWVGGDRQSRHSGAPLSARGEGAGLTCHHVGGGDNPNVVPTASRPFRQRPPQIGITWAVREPAVVAVPKATPPRATNLWRTTPPNRIRKISAEQETEMAKRYLDGESAVTLGRAFEVNERTVRKHLLSLGVPLRTRAEALKLRHDQRRAMVTVELPVEDVA